MAEPGLRVEEVRAARRRLAEHLPPTPCVSFAAGDAGTVVLKLETLQPMGAFKARGALNFLLCLVAEHRPGAVATYSSGNHGTAVAWAARRLGLPATVFVPEDIPPEKAAAIERWGGTVKVAGRTSADRLRAAESFARDRDVTIVPPFDHPWIIAGQGTVGLELLEQVPALRRVWVPAGGGGLCSGIALATRGQGAEVEVVAVEPDTAASLQAALGRGEPVEIAVGPTVADGLRPVRAGARCVALLMELGCRSVTVSDASILAAMRRLFDQSHLVVEPSGAAALAALLDHSSGGAGTDAVVLSGGNVSFERFTRLLAGAPA